MTSPLSDTTNQPSRQEEPSSEMTPVEAHAKSATEPTLLSILSGDDDVVKNRLVGALVWILLLLWFVPSWYSDPAYQQQPKLEQANHHQTVVIKPLVKPPEVIAEEQAKAAHAAKLKKEQEERDRQVRLERERIAQQAAVEKQIAKVQSAPQSKEQTAQSVTTVKHQASTDKAYIAKLATFEDKRLLDAAVAKAKKAGYQLVYKSFPKTQGGKTYLLFSLRTEMYDSYDKAQKAKQNLDKILRLKGSYVQSIDLKSQN
ncbi:SPOR domain-containing protein [uncultured Thiomicrorhabdus sp.]